MSARVYVAAPFTDWRLVREVHAEIRARGGSITCDWTAGAESNSEGTTDADVPEDVAIKAAEDDLRGVLDAQALLLLTIADKSRGCGCWIELGVALGESVLNYSVTTIRRSSLPRIAVCGPQRDRTIFARLCRRFPTWQDALPYVLGE